MRLEPPYAYKASTLAVTYVCNKEKHHAAWDWQHCTCWHDSATCRQSPQSTGALAPRAQLSGAGSSTAATSDLPQDTHSCAQISSMYVSMYVLFVMSWGSLGPIDKMIWGSMESMIMHGHVIAFYKRTDTSHSKQGYHE